LFLKFGNNTPFLKKIVPMRRKYLFGKFGESGTFWPELTEMHPFQASKIFAKQKQQEQSGLKSPGLFLFLTVYTQRVLLSLQGGGQEPLLQLASKPVSARA